MRCEKTTLHKILLAWSNHGGRMGKTCITYGAIRNAYQILIRKSEGKNHPKDLGVDGRTILKLISVKQCVECRPDSLGILVVTVILINFRFHERWRIYRLAEHLLDSQEGLCSVVS
jgi:hypothetical protein